MYDNIDEKLKMLAFVQFILGILGSVILGFFLFDTFFLLRILVVLFGSLMSWLSSLTTYGLGEAIEKATIAAEQAQNPPQNAISNEYAELLAKLQQREKEEELRQKKIRQEELRQRLPQDEAQRIDLILNEISSCDSFHEIQKCWERYPENTFRNHKQISERIANLVELERLYGKDKGSVSSFLIKIREELFR